MVKRTSQQIGAAHEKAVRRLLDDWAVHYLWKPRFRTSLGTTVEIDCFLPPTGDQPAVVLECKDFAVEAKNPEDSRRRKTQEALWLLIQVRRYCAETKTARVVLITGPTGFREDQRALLRAELGDDFHIVALADASSWCQLLGAVAAAQRES
jgi:hypothetical protein